MIMQKDLLLASVGLALFIVCPRMAGMVNVVSKHSQTSLVLTALFGTLISIPLVVAMVFVFAEHGVWGALAFCVLTDLGAVLFMREISVRAGIETLVIAIFVVIGVKVAPLITTLFFR
jgi:hypothetical protein